MSSSSSLTDEQSTMSGYGNGSIVLNEARNIYYAGQVLSGKIEFELDQPLEFKAINLVFHGEASVSWNENEIEESNRQQRHLTVEYGAQEVYFHIEQCICGGVDATQLNAGTHSIPFSFQIPHTVPSSFDEEEDYIPEPGDITCDDDEEASIIYYVQAVAEYAGGGCDELSQRFRVIVPLDLNLIPDMKVPREIFYEEALTSFFCGSGLLRVDIELPATGFCSGQTIPIMVKADNRSSVEVTKIVFELVRRVKYISTNPPSQKIEPDLKLGSKKTGAIFAKTEKNFTCYFVVPDMIAVVTENCGIIKVGYFLKVKLKLSGCNDVKEDEVEIALGHIPLRELIDDNYEHPLSEYLPQGPVPKLNETTVFQPNISPTSNTQIYSNYPDANRNLGSNYIQATGGNPPYPGGNAPYPGGNAPYPGGNAHYPGGNALNPGGNAPYPGGNAPYPGGNTPYPGGNAPYPGGDATYPGGNAPYPGGNAPYPGGNAPYPGGNAPYPGGNAPYPGGNAPYPGGNATYPAGNAPYPGGNAPYPGGNSPYPGSNPPYPTGNSYPGTNPPNSNFGFVVPVTGPGYPGVSAPPPYNPSAPPE